MWRDRLMNWLLGPDGARTLRAFGAVTKALPVDGAGAGGAAAVPTTTTSTDEEVGGTAANEELYVTHPWVYACVDAIAKRIARIVPVPSQRPESPEDEPTPVQGTWLNQLVKCPNPDTSWYDLIEGTVSYLELNGNSFWEWSWPGGGMPMGAEAKTPPIRADLLRSDRMKVIPSAAHRVDHYEYEVERFSAAGPQTLVPEKVLHFKYFHPLNEQIGLGPATPAESALAIDYYAIAVITDFLKHGAMPEGLIKFDEYLTPENIAFVRGEIQRLYQGAGKTHRTLIGGKGMDYKATQKTPAEAGLTDTRHGVREDILAAFGVPPVIVGVLKDASWANAHEQKVEFWGGTLMPKLTKVYETINARIARYTPDIVLVPDLSRVAHFLDEYEGKHRERKIGLEEIDRLALTPNEYRERYLARKPVGWGNEVFVPATSVPASEAVGLSEELDALTAGEGA